MSSNSNPARLFPIYLLWLATEYHRPVAEHRALANKFRLPQSAHLSLFGTQSTENRWHVLPPELRSNSWRKRASLICSPTTDIFCSNFRGNLVPIVFFVILTHHIICKDTTLYLFNDVLRTQKSQIQKIRLLNTDFATKIEISKKQTSTFIYDYFQDKSQLLQFKHHSMGFTNSSSCHSARETIALYCSKVKSDSLSSEHSYSHGSS